MEIDLAGASKRTNEEPMCPNRSAGHINGPITTTVRTHHQVPSGFEIAALHVKKSMSIWIRAIAKTKHNPPIARKAVLLGPDAESSTGHCQSTDSVTAVSNIEPADANIRSIDGAINDRSGQIRIDLGYRRPTVGHRAT
jgi:hypothetical protein